YHSNSLSALQAVEITLDKMAQGGIYDQVGGGFARYSVDGVWRVPHFEKMLYDNGQLISLYAEAFQQMKKERYKEVVYQSIDFVLRDMRSPEGGFYSALDADSEGVEGKFYLFTTEELKEILDTDAPALIDYYNATPEGNWEHSNILYITDDIETIAKRHGLKTTELKETIQTAKQKLLATRNTRVRPALDDKILCAWNALMLKGLVDAYRAFGEKRFLEAALANANFIEKKLLQEDGRLFRNFKNGGASINAFLEDYSFTIEAFIALYQVTFEAKWLSLAEKMTTYTIAHFYDEESKLFFFTSKLDKAIISRSSELTDNVIPSPNSSMAKALFLLGQLLYEDKYLSLSETMLRQIAANIAPNAAFMANWATLLFLHTSDQYQLSILGDNALEIQHAFDKVFLPNVVFAGDTTESELPALAHKYVTGENLIYICKNKACDAPVHSVEEALDIIRK
ncbi:MAG TPA: thioredoxin domain-containing protein, partial [Phaeodactylibacter sp.]|nr:thioredoxin domain-containing protein [Phaeodactylibacter sp.]